MNVLCVQMYPGANETVARHFPYYEKAGADLIVGITTQGGGCQWPGAYHAEIGRDSYVDGPHLCVRLLGTLIVAKGFDASKIVVIEHDCIFLKPFPWADLKPGLTMNPTGGPSPGFEGQAYYHCPWAMDLETAEEVYACGMQLVRDGRIERGFPDRFIGFLAEQCGFPVHTGVFKNFSQNALDRPEYIEAARRAIADGAVAVHGIKTKEQLEAVTS